MKGFLIYAAAAVVFLMFANALYTPRDNSDPPGGRSGMAIYVDHLTGCEYLFRAGLTPRMDGNGRQLGCR